jgi:hypothetical protein
MLDIESATNEEAETGLDTDAGQRQDMFVQCEHLFQIAAKGKGPDRSEW